jgi:predicted phosphodiesterase
VLLSDIHFNPLADPALVPQLMAADASQWESIFAADPHPAVPAYLSDTVWSLFASVVSQVQNVQPRPKLVIVTGDILAHKLQSKFASITQANDPAAFRNFEKKTVDFIGIELEKAAGGVPVFLTLGNNDEDCGDYALQPGGPFLKDSAATVQTLSKSDTKAMASWVTLGSYVAENPLASHHRIIVLNTNFWSGRYKNTCGSGDSGPAVLSWLSDQLQDAKKASDKVWLVYHIPPGIDGHTSSHTKQVVPFWKPDYLEGFTKLLDEYRGTIELNLAGHTHMDDFRLVQTTHGDALVLINPGVSPNVGQNPAYRVITVDSHARLEDILTYYTPDLEPPKWQLEYKTRPDLGLKEIDAKDYETLYRQLGDSATVDEKWKLYYSVSRPAAVSTDKGYVRSLYCASGHSEPDAFEACIHQ